MSQNPVLLNISEAAQRSGLSAKMIRYYESIGLVAAPARSASGYRLYSTRNIEKLSFIYHARELGFSVAQITDLLRLREDPTRASREVKQLAEQHVALLDQRLAQLRAMKNLLVEMIDQCSGNDDPHCSILDSLATTTLERS